VDTVGADPMVAVMAVDTGKFLDSSTPPRRPAARSAGRFPFSSTPYNAELASGPRLMLEAQHQSYPG
jgi:hypothetical protein